MRFEKFRPHYTVADYRQWEGDWELIDGLPHAMSPSPTDRHQSLGVELVTQISMALKGKKKDCGDCRVVYELDWIIDNENITRPDIAIICNERKDFIPSPPVLIIEILSPSTALKDRHIKFEIYQEQGVPYYILADPTAKTYSIFQLVNGQYVEQPNLQEFVIHPDCNIPIDFHAAMEVL